MLGSVIYGIVAFAMNNIFQIYSGDSYAKLEYHPRDLELVNFQIYSGDSDARVC